MVELPGTDRARSPADPAEVRGLKSRGRARPVRGRSIWRSSTAAGRARAGALANFAGLTRAERVMRQALRGSARPGIGVRRSLAARLENFMVLCFFPLFAVPARRPRVGTTLAPPNGLLTGFRGLNGVRRLFTAPYALAGDRLDRWGGDRHGRETWWKGASANPPLSPPPGPALPARSKTRCSAPPGVEGTSRGAASTRLPRRRGPGLDPLRPPDHRCLGLRGRPSWEDGPKPRSKDFKGSPDCSEFEDVFS